MAVSPRQVVWDSATWVALIMNEEGRVAKARGVIQAAARGLVEIVSPALALVETCGNKVRAVAPDKVEAFFDHDYVQVAPLDVVTAKTAREVVMKRFSSDLGYCKPCDATFVATAIEWNIPELHTFDEPLIRMSGRFATRNGDPIVICHPRVDVGGSLI